MMAAHLSVVPGHEPGATAPNETTKRPWEAVAGDVIVRNPDHPDQHVTWTVTGEPHSDGWFTYLTFSMPEGGEGVATCQPGQYVTLRGPATYVAEALYTGTERDEALQALSCGDRAYIAAFIRQYYPEVFDHALKRLTEREVRITAHTTSQEAGTP